MAEKLTLEVDIIPNMSAVDAELKKPRSMLGDIQSSLKTAKSPGGGGKDKPATEGSFLKGLGIWGIIAGLLMSLKPVQMLLKIISAILTMTLYPLIKFVLMILKPVIVFLFKTLILLYKFLTKSDTKKDIAKLDPSGQMLKRFEGLDEQGQQLVNLGQQIGKLFGVDLIGSGKALGDFLRSLPARWDIFVRAVGEFWSNAVTQAGEAWDGFMNYLGNLKTSFDQTMQPLWAFIGALPGSFKETIKPLLDYWAALPSSFKETIQPLLDFLTKAKQQLDDSIRPWIDYIKTIPGMMSEKLADWAKWAVNLPTWMLDQLKGLVGIGKKIFDTIIAAVKDVIRQYLPSAGSGSSTSKRASGGPVSGGGTYLVGEKGPELFTPGGAGSITPNNRLGGGTTNITINVQGNVDSQATINKIVEAVNRAQYQNSKKVGAW